MKNLTMTPPIKLQRPMESSTISYRKRSIPFYRRPGVAAWAVIVVMALLLTLYFVHLS